MCVLVGEGVCAQVLSMKTVNENIICRGSGGAKICACGQKNRVSIKKIGHEEADGNGLKVVRLHPDCIPVL